jgi:prolyl-tRNA synthetase
LRIEVGPRDLENNQAILARRDNGEKVTVSLDNLVAEVESTLVAIQDNMFQKAVEFREANSHTHIDSIDELKGHIAKAEEESTIAGWVLAGWCGDDACESKVKEETSFTSRNIPFEPPVKKETCICCGKQAEHTVWFSRAY